MHIRYSRALATATAVATGGLAVLALRPPQTVKVSAVAERNPAVQVRTEIIRRTIRIVRHEPGAVHPVPRAVSAHLVGYHGTARSRASGSHHSALGGSAPAVSTRVSGSHPVGTVSASAPVSTHTSGSHGGSTAPASGGTHVTTRSSGSASHGGSTSGRPVSRTSGGGGGESDHGDNGGGGNGGGDD